MLRNRKGALAGLVSLVALSIFAWKPVPSHWEIGPKARRIKTTLHGSDPDWRSIVFDTALNSLDEEEFRADRRPADPLWNFPFTVNWPPENYNDDTYVDAAPFWGLTEPRFHFYNPPTAKGILFDWNAVDYMVYNQQRAMDWLARSTCASNSGAQINNLAHYMRYMGQISHILSDLVLPEHHENAWHWPEFFTGKPNETIWTQASGPYWSRWDNEPINGLYDELKAMDSVHYPEEKRGEFISYFVTNFGAPADGSKSLWEIARDFADTNYYLAHRPGNDTCKVWDKSDLKDLAEKAAALCGDVPPLPLNPDVCTGTQAQCLEGSLKAAVPTIAGAIVMSGFVRDHAFLQYEASK